MSCNLDPSDKIILALDGMDPDESIKLVSKIDELIWVKVGLELFMRAGPEFLQVLQSQRKKIFLDLKFHDIPITMSHACRQAVKSGVELMTVHACAGSRALLEARKGAEEGALESGLPIPRLLAVTVLTSWNQEDFESDLALKLPIHERVQLMAELASQSGLGGCVCSPWEVASLREKYPEPFELITPGIRLKGEDLNDQRRVMTPSEAIQAGASKLVIGRSITRSKNPLEAFERICEDLILA